MTAAQMAEYLAEHNLSHGRLPSWVCVQPDCDNEHHFYVRAES
jgi:hypothetical protein